MIAPEALFNAASVLAHADLKRDAEFTEVLHRAAISRAYYSVFLVAREIARSAGHQSSEGGPHDQVWSYFAPRGRIYDSAMKLKRQRIDADYKLGKKHANAVAVVRRAADLLRDLRPDIEISVWEPEPPTSLD